MKSDTMLELASIDPKLSVRRLAILLLLDEHGKMTNAEIKEAANFKSDTYTRLFINDAEHSNYIKRLEGRPIQYTLTPKGKKALELIKGGKNVVKKKNTATQKSRK